MPWVPQLSLIVYCSKTIEATFGLVNIEEKNAVWLTTSGDDAVFAFMEPFVSIEPTNI